MIQQLAQQVAIPPDAKVDAQPAPLLHTQSVLVLWVLGILCRGHHVAFHVANAVAVAAPQLPSVVGGVDVGSHGAAHVAGAFDLKHHLARPGIAQVAAVSAVLVAVQDI